MKENRNAFHHFDRDLGIDAPGCSRVAPHVGPQQELGLWPEWWPGIGSYHPDYPRCNGENLVREPISFPPA